VKDQISGLQVKFVQISREENECADRLAKAALAKYILVPDQVLSFIQTSSLIDEVMSVHDIGIENNWTTPLISYLRDGMLLDGKDATRKLEVQASHFVLIKEVIYKRGFSRPSLRCLGPEEVNFVIRKVHEGICRNHSRSRSLVNKLIRAGYYWPTMQKDAQTYVKACNKC